MTITEALLDYSCILQQIQELNREIRFVMDNRHDTSITARLTGMPSSGKIADPTLGAVEKLDEVELYIQHIYEKILRCHCR